jgi:hypothetical protein
VRAGAGCLLELDPEPVERGAKSERVRGSSAIQSGSSGRLPVLVQKIVLRRCFCVCRRANGSGRGHVSGSFRSGLRYRSKVHHAHLPRVLLSKLAPCSCASLSHQNSPRQQSHSEASDSYLCVIAIFDQPTWYRYPSYGLLAQCLLASATSTIPGIPRPITTHFIFVSALCMALLATPI